MRNFEKELFLCADLICIDIVVQILLFWWTDFVVHGFVLL